MWPLSVTQSYTQAYIFVDAVSFASGKITTCFFDQSWWFFPPFFVETQGEKNITSIPVPICCPSSDVWPCFIWFHLFTFITLIPFDLQKWPSGGVKSIYLQLVTFFEILKSTLKRTSRKIMWNVMFRLVTCSFLFIPVTLKTMYLFLHHCCRI